MWMPLIISTLLLVTFTVIIFKFDFFHLNGVPRWLIATAFFAKLIGGISIWYIYTYHYTDRSTADIYKYFDDARIIMHASSKDKAMRWQVFLPIKERNERLDAILKDTQHWDKKDVLTFNDNRSIIRIHLLILYLSKGFFHLHTLLFCMFSFLGSIALIHFFQLFSKSNPLILFLLVFFIPSTLLFASGALKESWLFFCLGFFLLNLTHTLLKRRINYLLGTLLFGFLLLSIKSYIILCISPAILYLIIQHVNPKRPYVLFSFIHILLVTVLLYFNPILTETLSAKQSAFMRLAEQAEASSYFEIASFSTLKELIFAIPQAVYNVWLRPLLPMNANLFSVLTSIESLMLISLIGLIFLFYRRPLKHEHSLMLLCVSFIISLSLIIGLVVPILGAVIRYKVPMLPFYSMLILSFIDAKKIPFLHRYIKK